MQATFILTFNPGLPLAGDAAGEARRAPRQVRQRCGLRVRHRGGHRVKAKPKKPPMIRDVSPTGTGRLRPAARRAPADPSMALPRYELRAHYFGPADTELEVWQLPSPATPTPDRPGARRRPARPQPRTGRAPRHPPLETGRHPVRGTRAPPARAPGQLPEDIALTLGLLFRALAPMRSRDNLRNVVEGIEQMGKEEAAYWLGMAMHRKNPRRVLSRAADSAHDA